MAAVRALAGPAAPEQLQEQLRIPVYIEERTTRAMGSDAQVIVYAHTQQAARDLAALALMRVELLEQCWSRFRADSELSVLNGRNGHGPVAISDDLETLLSVMLEAAEWTQGAFDPTVLHAMHRIGYDADFATVVARDTLADLRETVSPTLGMTGIVIDSDRHTAELPAGVGVDPGAIGKGLAADIVASEIHAAGAEGVLVNLGGDVSVRGTAAGQPWVVGIHDDRQPGSPVIARVTLDGDRRAVATSSSLRRRWQGRHHVIDPLTGLPATADVAQVTVIAPTGWQAEAATTFALVRGMDAAQQWLTNSDLEAYLYPHDPTAAPHLIQEAQHA